MAQYFWLVPVGFLVGTFGTLIGAGGGFLLMPLLLLFYPAENAGTLTSISLAVVFFNALSGSMAYARARRIDYYSGLLFAVAGIPGAVAGALSTAFLPRRLFDFLIGAVMLIAAGFLFLRPSSVRSYETNHQFRHFAREVVDAEGIHHRFGYNRLLALAVSLLVGFISSLLGIGGGFIHVPALVHILNFPVHIATATSHFILAIIAFAGTATHVLTGAFQHGIRRTIMLSIGVVLGAQLGARLSKEIRPEWIIRILALAMALAGARLVADFFRALTIGPGLL